MPHFLFSLMMTFLMMRNTKSQICFNYSGRITGTVLLINVALVASQIIFLILLFNAKSKCQSKQGNIDCDLYKNEIIHFLLFSIFCVTVLFSQSMYSSRYQRRLYNKYLKITSVINGDLAPNNLISANDTKAIKKLLTKG